MTLFSYWCICGIVLVCIEYYTLNYSKDVQENKELVEKVQLMSGLDEKAIHNLVYLLSMLLGGALLPYAIICKIYKLITGKNLENEILSS